MKWQAFNWIDYLIVTVLVISTLISLIRGFIREALSLVAWIAAFWVALTFNGDLAELLKPYIATISLRIGIAFFILFGLTLIIGATVNYLIASIVDKTGLSGTDRLLGVLFGFGRGVLLIAVLLLAARIGTFSQGSEWRQSQLIPAFIPLESWLSQYLPKNIKQNLYPGFFKFVHSDHLVLKNKDSIKKRTADFMLEN